MPVCGSRLLFAIGLAFERACAFAGAPPPPGFSGAMLTGVLPTVTITACAPVAASAGTAQASSATSVRRRAIVPLTSSFIDVSLSARPRDCRSDRAVCHPQARDAQAPYVLK